MSDNPNISISEMAAASGITSIGVRYHLDAMRKEGLLQRSGTKGGAWILTKT